MKTFLPLKPGIFVVLLFAAVVGSGCKFADKPAGIYTGDITPPVQPKSGPGSSEYAHGSVTKSHHGTGGTRYWLFEPADPKPKSAPVVIFNHGWGAMNPRSYLEWIKHIVRRGSVVIYPRYQNSIFTRARHFTPNAISAIKSAIAKLKKAGHVSPQLDNVCALGHSMGGVLTANIAALAERENLPKIRAMMCVEPGGPVSSLEDYARIPSDTLMLLVVGADDRMVGNRIAKKIFFGATQVSLENKDFITVHTDEHGEPPLVAGHFAPLAGSFFRPDALDWYGFWKWFDALSDFAVKGRNRAYGLDGTGKQRHLGTWSDGTDVRKADVTDSP
ncbi:MAG: alpha/beta hydrolase [Planctomycetota bacterium]|nr:MAG: alpha/beta hydrolase [Planctomycetota bacterium]